MSATALPVARSGAALPEGGPLRREPRAKGRARPEAFHRAFDDRTLFYDCFRDVSGARILLVGPPPMNLTAALRQARFVALPSGTPLRARFHPSLSTMITALDGAPADTSAVEIAIDGTTLRLTVAANSSEQLAGRRVLFSINRDNDLAWIREWALFHARTHGTDAVILVDNGSTRYGPDEVLATLRDVPGIAFAGVPVWPDSFGPVDPAVTGNPYWARFLQIGSMSMVLRRYGERAYGLLDCDVDELAGTHSGRSVYDLARASRGGLVAFRGSWVEADRSGSRHRDYSMRLADPAARQSHQRKWALDPSRAWVRNLGVHPYWHWIEGRPFWAKSMPEDAFYWHFRGINTNWKLDRTRPPGPDAPLEADELLGKRIADMAH